MNALGILAARALGVPARVRPRLALRFEASAPEPASEMAAAAPATAGLVPRISAPAPDGAGRAATVAGTPGPGSRAAMRGDALEGRPNPSRPLPDAEPAEPPAYPAAAPSPVQERVIHRLAMSAVDTAPAEAAATAPLLPASLPDAAAPRAPLADGPRRAAFEPLLPREPVPAFALPALPGAAATASAEPVTVTIGRIEVRAEMPRRPAPASAPARPARAGPRLMSLEDHLARRRP